MLGVSPWTILNWETGRTEPLAGSISALLCWLGYDRTDGAKQYP